MEGERVGLREVYLGKGVGGGICRGAMEYALDGIVGEKKAHGFGPGVNVTASQQCSYHSLAPTASSPRKRCITDLVFLVGIVASYF